MSNPKSPIRDSQFLRGFTLMELLIVILIIGIIAGMSMMALAGAAESAREQRSRAIVNKIDQLIRDKYESYRTRAVPVRVPLAVLQAPALNPPGPTRIAAMARLYALRDLMRMELPDRVTDVSTPRAVWQPPPATSSLLLGSDPSLVRHYRRKAVAGWTVQNQGAECLYLILSAMKDGDKNAIDFFLPEEIGDTDEDGMKEILDAWGTPILFLRWAPGYVPTAGPDGVLGTADDLGPLTMQTTLYTLAPDPFDPLKCDPQWTTTTGTYALYPLIASAGRDKIQDIAADLGTTDVVYRTLSPPNNPYNVPAAPYSMFGTVGDMNADGDENWADNITNHYQAPP